MTKQQRKAVAYLDSKPNYRLIHEGTRVSLLHYGSYGWSVIEGSYYTWEVVFKGEF